MTVVDNVMARALFELSGRVCKVRGVVYVSGLIEHASNQYKNGMIIFLVGGYRGRPSFPSNSRR